MEATAQLAAMSPKRKHGRGAASNNPWRLGRQTPRAIARRRRDLIQAFVTALGGPEAVGEMVTLQIKKAAELLALAEAVRAGLFGNPTRDVTPLIRLEGEARRTLRALGIKTEPDKLPPGLERARQRMDAQARSENTKAAKAVRREKPPQQRRVRPPDDDEAQETD